MDISTKMRVWIHYIISKCPLTSLLINLNFFKSFFNGSTVWVFRVFLSLIKIITRTGMYLKVVSGCNVKPSQFIIFRRISLHTFSSRLNEFHSYQKASQLIRFYQFDQVFSKEPFQRASIFCYLTSSNKFIDTNLLCQC